MGQLLRPSLQLEHALWMTSSAKRIAESQQIPTQPSGVVYARIRVKAACAIGDQVSQDEPCPLDDGHRALADEVQGIGDL